MKTLLVDLKHGLSLWCDEREDQEDRFHKLRRIAKNTKHEQLFDLYMVMINEDEISEDEFFYAQENMKLARRTLFAFRGKQGLPLC